MGAHEVYKRPDSLDQAVALWGRQLWAFCRTKARDTAEADDLYQATWLRAREKWSGFRGDGDKTLFSWLCTIAMRIFIRWRRQTNRKVFYDSKAVRDVARIGDQSNPYEVHLFIAHAFSTITKKNRKVFELAKYDNLTYEQIAEQIGLSKNQVHHCISETNKTLVASKSIHEAFDATKWIELFWQQLGQHGPFGPHVIDLMRLITPNAFWEWYEYVSQDSDVEFCLGTHFPSVPELLEPNRLVGNGIYGIMEELVYIFASGDNAVHDVRHCDLEPLYEMTRADLLHSTLSHNQGLPPHVLRELIEFWNKHPEPLSQLGLDYKQLLKDQTVGQGIVDQFKAQK